MSGPVLRLDQVQRTFGGLRALRPLSMDLLPGARHAVIGANGAGKTTLVNLITGALRPSGGRVLLAGRDITGLSIAHRARLGIARTWQHPAIYRHLTVADNLAVAARRPATAAALRPQAQRLTAAGVVGDLLGRTGLDRDAMVPAGRLPYGRQRLVELAMVLATRPHVVILDEPSAGLGADDVTGLVHLIDTLPPEAAVLLIDHNLDLVWRIADRVTVLDRGRWLTAGTPEQVRADPAAIAAYLPALDSTSTPAAPDHIRGAAAARPAARATLLRVRQLHAGYTDRPVLHSVDLDVDAGEVLAVLGRNGAGKTTLLNTIGGLLPAWPPTRIEFDDQPPRTRPQHRIAHAGIAIVPQQRRLFAGLTVDEHLHLAARHAPPSTFARCGGPRRRFHRDEIWRRFPELRERRRHPAESLSGGEQQMLAIARALLTQPRLLLLDEPAEGLSPTLTALLAELIRQLALDGITSILAEQNISLAQATASRVIVVDGGRITFDGSPSVLTDGRRLGALLGMG